VQYPNATQPSKTQVEPATTNSDTVQHSKTIHPIKHS
jgi:hypothetical protein